MIFFSSLNSNCILSTLLCKVPTKSKDKYFNVLYFVKMGLNFDVRIKHFYGHFHNLWPCLFTIKISYTQLFKWGHSKSHGVCFDDGCSIGNYFNAYFQNIKLFWPFTVQIDCSCDLKKLPSASNFKSFSETLDQSFLTVGQSNFGNKIPFLWGNVERDRPVQWIQLSCTRIVKMHIKIVNYYCWCPWNWTEYKIYSELHLVWKKYQLDHKLALFLLRIFFLSL